jgi:methylmalonyl-CoA mutase
MDLDPYNWEIILTWNEKINKYKDPVYTFKVRDKEIKMPTHTESLSHSQIPKIALPKYKAWGDILRWCLQENVPGEYPFTAGLYPFKRAEKILLVCLQVREDQKEQTNVFIT